MPVLLSSVLNDGYNDRSIEISSFIVRSAVRVFVKKILTTVSHK